MCNDCPLHLQHALSALILISARVNTIAKTHLRQPRFVYDTNLQLSDHNFQSIHFEQIVLNEVSDAVRTGE